jgi:D-3-phosphoglycerate dehydrogenase
MTPRVVVTDHAFGDVEVERRAAIEHGATFEDFQCRTVEETIEAVRGADVMLVNFAPFPAAVIEQLPAGSTIIRYGVGYDNVDLDAAVQHRVRVANVPDYGTETVGDHAAASILALTRRLHLYDRRIRDEGWVSPSEVGSLRSLRRMTIGFIGMGRTARAVHARLRAFGCRFVAHDPYADTAELAALDIESLNLDALARRADVITLHCASTPETRGMIGRAFLADVRPGTIIVNTARGSLVDERALIEALADGRIAAAALDVTDPEPVPADSPLRDFPQVLLTPHAAFYDDDSLLALQRLASEEMVRALEGRPLRCRVA